MVVEILVAQSQAEHPLRDQIQQRVLDLIRLTAIGEASGEPAHDPGPLLQFFQQQDASVGGDVAAIEAPNQFPSSQFCEVGSGCASGWNRRAVRSGVMTSPIAAKTWSATPK